MKQAWHTRTRHALGHSLRLRLILVFFVLAAAMSALFITSLQKAFSLSWREAARPMLMDYVDRLAADIAPSNNSPPSIERAQALTDRLPITVRISGAQINWQSHPEQARPEWKREEWEGDSKWRRMVERQTDDGHTIEFGLNVNLLERRPALLGFALLSLLIITVLAFLYVRKLLRPLDDIRAGAQRFGGGNFSQPIAVRHAQRPDELGQLAHTINTMGQDIEQMLDAKRALLLAISHELRSPLTRARLNTELLPETPELLPGRAALLRDLALMRDLVSDLLEGERLASPHVILQREATDLAALAIEASDSVMAQHSAQGSIQREIQASLPSVSIDRTRIRLLLRNLLDNALRHNAKGPARMLHHDSVRRAQNRDGWVQAATTRGRVPSGRSSVRPDARVWDAADAEGFCGVQMKLEKKLSGAETKGSQNGAHGETSGLAAPAVLLTVAQTQDGKLCITVRDFGAGVDEVALEQLAQPFYRPDASRERATGGVGLGLYLCKLVAQAHGGSMTIRNALPGLAVTVILPLA